MPNAPRDRNGFQVALFCALPLEAENVQSMFDTCWEDQDMEYGKAVGDQNSYTTGLIGKCNVVLVHMPSMGGNSAALAAAGLRSSFQQIQLALVVGICGVVPVHPATKQEIILGDIVISTAVIQYDFGRQYPTGFQRKKITEDSLGRANPEIRSFINMLSTRQNRQRFNERLGQLIQSKEFQDEVPAASYPGVAQDRLYEASYIHGHRSDLVCNECLLDLGTCSKTCDELQCEDNRLVTRKRHSTDIEKLGEGGNHTPCVHLGRFGSANTVMKSGLDRDRISTADEVTAFEMEGAGVWEQYPTVVIKAACDYADSHKDKRWQGYAAAMAAACLKVFLKVWTIPKQLSDHDESLEPVWHIPFDRMTGFVGRADNLHQLEQKLFDPNSCRVVSLLGLGGVGKSRLASELAYQVKSKRPHYSILWIQASGQLTLEKDMLEIGKKFKIPGIADEKADIKTLVKQRLSLPSKDKWLLILDGADDETLWGRRQNSMQQGISLADYLPQTMNGSILITTRTRRVASFLADKDVINLGALTQDEAADLFVTKLEYSDPLLNRGSLLVLVNQLANLPLAVVQAASYINMNEMRIETYLQLLNQPETEVVKLLSKDFGDASRYPNAINPVATTWLISFEQIQKQHSLAADFLSAIACIHEKGIPLSLLPVGGSRLDTIEALSVLTGYSFITKQSGSRGVTDEDDLYDVHRLVQLAARGWLTKEGFLAKWTEACTIRLAQVFPTRIHKNKSIWTMYMPHAQRICAESTEEDFIYRYELLEKMGLCLFADGKYDEAVKAQNAVVEWREHALGVSHSKTLKAYHDLGEALGEQGNLYKAEDYLRRAIDGWSDMLGKTHISVLISMGNLALVLNKQGKYLEAEKMHREVIHFQEIVLGRSNSETLISKNNLALALTQQAKYIESEEIFREVLLLRETELGRSDPATLASINNLAFLLYKQGQYSKAEELHREASKLLEEALGRSHPATLVSMNNLGSALCSQGKYIEAEELHRETLRLQETVLGRRHPETIVVIENLALSLVKQHKFIEAEILYLEVLQLRETTLGRRHESTLRIVSHVANLFSYQGKHAEAEEMDREVLQSQEMILGRSHPLTLTTLNNLAWDLYGQNRVEEAIILVRSCAEQMVNVLGPTHPDTRGTSDTLKEWLKQRQNEIQMPGSWPE